MTGVPIVTGRLERRVGVIGPDVRRLHSGVAILAICDRVTWKARHEAHLPHTAARVLNKPPGRRQGHDQAVDVKVYAVAKLRVFRNGVQIAPPPRVSCGGG